MKAGLQGKTKTDQRSQLLFTAFVELEGYVQEYRKALLWLTHGNHTETPHPTEKETRQLIKALKNKIIDLLTEIEPKKHYLL
jgi:hypothetical protein